ncbi:cation:proton antiporter [Cellulomonas sp. HZM]|uniref:cation:proton antiporter n=1 Tax=Cellulomonas sp. HZM TaxID=1454010 RepID=UPI000551DF03|nr:cation:proton antiporter [Cellulomonas sp. HZM]
MEFDTLLPVVAVSVLTLVAVSTMPARWRLPQVVVLLAGGVLIGPECLHWSSPEAVGLLSDLGMGFLFLLAGYEIDPGIGRQPAGRLGVRAWLTSIVLGALLLVALSITRDVPAIVAITIALSTTALGVLVPVLKEEGLTDRPLGRYVMAGGAVGELGPIVAMALFLGTRGTLVALVALVLFAAAVVVLGTLPRRFAFGRTRGLLRPLGDGTGQGPVRVSLLLLVGLLALSSSMGFDAVLGAFLAGMVLRSWVPAQDDDLSHKLETVGWGVFIPIFFVSSGMALQLDAIAEQPWLPIVFVVLIGAVRGGPALFWYRRHLVPRERVQLGLYTATTLPMLVALTQLAVDEGSLPVGTAGCLVFAGALTVLLFPLLARTLGATDRTEAAGTSGADDPGDLRDAQ